MKISHIILICCTLSFSMAANATPNVVTTAFGKLEGVNHKQYQFFGGIPYAKPPVGNLRWHAPEPIAQWQGIKVAKSFANDCMQKPFPSDAAPLGNTPAEDCLYLNVWTPKVSASKQPVMVWIHGGGFMNGGSSPAVYSGESFAKNGIVFVSFNYRLGRFGFFSHPAFTAAGEEDEVNYGLMDQVAALQWIHQNIAAFGGDPNNVTLVGESAGGFSIHYLLQPTYAKTLFQQAVIMSGGGRSRQPTQRTRSTVNLPSAQQIGMNFAAKFGIYGADKASLHALRSLSPQQVTDDLNLMALFSPTKATQPTFFYGVAADGFASHKGQNHYALDKQHAIPILLGATYGDIGFLNAKNKDELFRFFGANQEQAKNRYDPNGNIEFRDLLAQVGQDFYMQEPARHIAKLITAQDKKAYLYRFGYVANAERRGQMALHASDIPFFFNTIQQKLGDKTTAEDLHVAKVIHQYLVNFIKNGKPAAKKQPIWDAFTDKGNIMLFTPNGDAKYQRDPKIEKLDLVEKTYH